MSDNDKKKFEEISEEKFSRKPVSPPKNSQQIPSPTNKNNNSAGSNKK